MTAPHADPVRELRDVGVVLRDGVRLSADLYLPDAALGRRPAVVYRTPYGRQRPRQVRLARALAARGFAVVLQDVRGRHDSDGAWVPFRNEGPDGYDTVEWAADQPWCSGRVGTMGGSYSGWCQWALAAQRPPHLVTMVSTATSGRWAQENPVHNGCVMLVMLAWLAVTGRRVVQEDLDVDWPRVLRHLPVQEMDSALGRELPVWREWVSHPALDDYWRSMRVDDALACLDLPVLHVTGWYDADQPGSLHFFRHLAASSANQHLVIGPWDHAGASSPVRVTGGVDFGPGAELDVHDLHAAWFGRWLADGTLTSPQVRYFLTGANEWQSGCAWPPAHDAVALHLRSGARLVLEPPQHDAPESFRYDPDDPVPSVVDERFYVADQQETPLDRRFQLERPDVLSWLSDAQSSPCVMAGEPVLVLHASTDGPDTDWFASLHDVAPDGTHLFLGEGRLRGRFHRGLDRESLLESGTVYRFRLVLTSLAHEVKRGHRLRLAVTSSDFPTWDRNPNTGRPIGQDAVRRVATNTVHYSSRHSSALILPVVSGLLAS